MTVMGDQHRQVAELLGPFALHAVDAGEAAIVETHLGECHRCRAEVDQLREVAAAIGHSFELPSEALWDRIAARLVQGGARPHPPEEVPVRHRQPAATGAGPMGRIVQLRRVGSITTHGPSDQHTPKKRVRRNPWTATGLAAVAACAALAVVFGVNWSEANGKVGQLQSALTRQGMGEAVEAALTSPGHRVLELRSTGGAQLAKVVVRQSGAGYVVWSHMPPLPADKTYQLWVEITDRPISLGLLGGELSLGDAFSLGSSAREARRLMVTVEPRGGVVVPTTPPIASAGLN